MGLDSHSIAASSLHRPPLLSACDSHSSQLLTPPSPITHPPLCRPTSLVPSSALSDGGPCTRSGDSTCRAGRRASTTAPEHPTRCPRPQLQVHRVMRPFRRVFPRFLLYLFHENYLCVYWEGFPRVWALPSTYGPVLGPLEGF